MVDNLVLSDQNNARTRYHASSNRHLNILAPERYILIGC
jgi:hypothetical protein